MHLARDPDTHCIPYFRLSLIAKGPIDRNNNPLVLETTKSYTTIPTL